MLADSGSGSKQQAGFCREERGGRVSDSVGHAGAGERDKRLATKYKSLSLYSSGNTDSNIKMKQVVQNNQKYKRLKEETL